MNSLRPAVQAGVALLLACVTPAAASDALFDGDEPLALELEAPIDELVRRRRQEPEFDALLRYTDSDGVAHTVPLEVEPRGNSRLEICRFPPIKFKFKRKQVVGTLFEGQRNMKLVTRCEAKREALFWLHLELGAYRAYNAITPYSYRTRLLTITYRDTGGGDEFTQPAFLLESDEMLGERIGRERIRPPTVDLPQMSLEETTLSILFHYLVGNTDFSVKRGPSGEGCCHNGRVFATTGRQDDYVIVPYDFDQAGIVDTDYALPDSRLGIHDVTQRVYRGFCWHNEALPGAIAVYNEQRAAVEAAFLTPVLSRYRTRRVQRFIDQFYNTLNDPEELQRRLVAKCREPGSMPLRASPGDRN